MQITAVDGFTLVTPSGRHNEAMEGSFVAETMDDVNEALQIRASGYLQKPVTGGNLQHAVDSPPGAPAEGKDI